MKKIINFLFLATCISLQELPAQWVLQNSGTTGNLIDVVIVMRDSTTAIAVGRNSSILRTTNTGATWSDVAAPLSYTKPWNAVSLVDTVSGIVVGDEGVVMTSTNGGKNWMWHQIPGRQKCFSIFLTGQYSYLVGADSGWIYQSNDTGNTWTSEKISAWPIRSIFQYRGAVIFEPPLYALTPYSFCVRYTIPPPAWSEKIIPQFQGLGSEGFSAEFCKGGGAGFIVGVQGDLRADPTILRKKKMSDTAWSKVYTGILKDGVLLGVSAPSANVIYVCGSEGMIFKSTNGGDTWKDISVPTTQSLNAIYFYNDKRGFVVGDSGKIYYTSSGGEITDVEEGREIVPSKFKLYQNYPNPFNPTTVISYQLPVNNHVSLKVYDMLGREVATLVDEVKDAGSYSVRWNFSSAVSGIYVYRLQSGKFSEAKKLTIIR